MKLRRWSDVKARTMSPEEREKMERELREEMRADMTQERTPWIRSDVGLRVRLVRDGSTFVMRLITGHFDH